MGGSAPAPLSGSFPNRSCLIHRVHGCGWTKADLSDPPRHHCLGFRALQVCKISFNCAITDSIMALTPPVLVAVIATTVPHLPVTRGPQPGGSSPCFPPTSSCLAKLGHNKSQSLQCCALALVNIYPHGAGLCSPELVQPGGSQPHGVLQPLVPWVTSCHHVHPPWLRVCSPGHWLWGQDRAPWMGIPLGWVAVRGDSGDNTRWHLHVPGRSSGGETGSPTHPGTGSPDTTGMGAAEPMGTESVLTPPCSPSLPCGAGSQMHWGQRAGCEPGQSKQSEPGGGVWTPALGTVRLLS